MILDNFITEAWRLLAVRLSHRVLGLLGALRQRDHVVARYNPLPAAEPSEVLHWQAELEVVDCARHHDPRLRHAAVGVHA